MKLYLSLLVILMVTHACWSQCRNANWWGSFDRTGWSTCDSTTEYLTGFFRNDQWQNDPIYLLEEGTCCKAPAPIQDQASTCTNANWWGVLDSIHRWGVCPDGYFLQGLYRTAGNNLHNIEEGRCCKPDNLPNSYPHCYDHDVSSSFNSKGWINCDDGYYLTGIYRGGCNILHCIDKFRCCKLELGGCNVE
ncbi:uncharacterized protein LOC144643797 [Oculina patagonica]